MTVANSYGHERFIELLNEPTDFENEEYIVTATFENGETLINFDPSLKEEHYIGICSIVLQAQGVSEQ